MLLEVVQSRIDGIGDLEAENKANGWRGVATGNGTIAMVGLPFANSSSMPALLH